MQGLELGATLWTHCGQQEREVGKKTQEPEDLVELLKN